MTNASHIQTEHENLTRRIELARDQMTDDDYRELLERATQETGH